MEGALPSPYFCSCLKKCLSTTNCLMHIFHADWITSFTLPLLLYVFAVYDPFASFIEFLTTYGIDNRNGLSAACFVGGFMLPLSGIFGVGSLLLWVQVTKHMAYRLMERGIIVKMKDRTFYTSPTFLLFSSATCLVVFLVVKEGFVAPVPCASQWVACIAGEGCPCSGTLLIGRGMKLYPGTIGEAMKSPHCYLEGLHSSKKKPFSCDPGEITSAPKHTCSDDNTIPWLEQTYHQCFCFNGTLEGTPQSS
jgi:hypothetical protein